MNVHNTKCKINLIEPALLRESGWERSTAYQELPAFRFCQKMLNDLSNKIKRAKERLLLTQMEQAANAGADVPMYGATPEAGGATNV